MARRWSEAERRDWVSRWRASGLSCVRFAAEHGLASATLYTWSHRVGRASSDSDPSLDVARREIGARDKASFTQVRVVGGVDAASAARGTVEVVLGNGCLVRVSGAVDESQLRSVLRVVSAC